MSQEQVINGNGDSNHHSNKQNEDYKDQNITVSQSNISKNGIEKLDIILNEDVFQKLSENEANNKDIAILEQYLLNCIEPVSLIQLHECFPQLKMETIHNLINQLEQNKQIGILRLYLPAKAKCNSIRIEYFDRADKQPELAKNVKKLEEMDDEELIEYEKSLNLKRDQVKQKRYLVNSKGEYIKIIQKYNTAKEICNIVFEKIANIQKKTLKEVCDDFGLNMNEE